MNGLVQRQPIHIARGMSAKRALAIWTALAVAALAVFVASLALGSVSVAPTRVFDALLPSYSP